MKNDTFNADKGVWWIDEKSGRNDEMKESKPCM